MFLEPWESGAETSERHTPKHKYEIFVTLHIQASAENVATKPRTECRVPYESLVIRKKPET